MSKDYTTTAKEHEYMRVRQLMNIANSKKNKTENWFDQYLKDNTKIKFSRQRRWGFRIFDFWSHNLGIAIEIDGPEHSKKMDEESDQREFDRSRIIVLRVRNNNLEDANKALSYVNQSETWNERRSLVGMKPIRQ